MPLSFDNTQIAFQYRSDRALKLAHLLFFSMSSPLLVKTGMQLTQLAFRFNLPVAGLVKKTIYQQFCGGESLQEAARTTRMLEQYGVDVALDYGVEGKQDETEFDAAVPQFLKTIDFAAAQPNVPFIPLKLTGFAAFGLLEKLHAGTALSAEETAAWNRVQDRVDRICRAAYQKGLVILIDAEESWIQQPVDALSTAMMRMYNKEKATVFNTYQLYRHDRLEFLRDSHRQAVEEGYILGAKLVRGAYMEKERARAEALGYPSPIQPDKVACDRDFDAAVDYALRNISGISVFIGTHNEASCLKACALMEALGLPPGQPGVYFSQLYGMSDNITFNLAHAGYSASKYLPYGPVKDVVPYLMRRARENTSVSGQTGRELLLIKKEMKRRGL